MSKIFHHSHALKEIFNVSKVKVQVYDKNTPESDYSSLNFLTPYSHSQTSLTANSDF